MSTVRFIERDGERLELPADSAIKSELRCDGCGEFLDGADHAAADVTIDLEPGSVNHLHTFHVDAHRPHLAAALARVVDPDADLP